MSRTALALAAVLALLACKGSTKHDRGTPEGTVRTFFQALNEGRIPRDLAQLFTDEHEVAVWELRCKHRGCAGGTLHKLTVDEKYEYRAVVRIEYDIRDRDGKSIMRGKMPVTLTREGKQWYIYKFGERRVIKTGKPNPVDRNGAAAAAADAGGQL